ncbi:MAG TPA: hypothetical protein VFV50_06330 [Bdellovibrionales bacterium]|nr:hypothetical protein [Bdellovibrionales bacterium]
MKIKDNIKLYVATICLILGVAPSPAKSEELEIESSQREVETVGGISLSQIDQRIEEMIRQSPVRFKFRPQVIKLMCTIFNFGIGYGFMEGRCVGSNLKMYKISVRTIYAYGISGVVLYGSFLSANDGDPRGRYAGAAPSAAILGGPIGLFGAGNDSSKYLILSGVQGGVFLGLPAESIEIK